MRSEQLEYVAAVARLGSFRRAADELRISQPALSATVRNLERELGVDLLVRERTGVHLTERGRELLPHIDSAIDAISELRDAAGGERPGARTIRVAAVRATPVTLLTTVTAAFRELHPATQIEMIGAQQAAVHTGLRAGSLELGLTTRLDGDEFPVDLETTTLASGRAVVCINTESPLAALDLITVPDLLTEPLVMMRSGYVMHRYVRKLLGTNVPELSYTTDGAEMAKVMVAEGLGATVLPDFTLVGDPLVRRGVITWRPLENAIGVQLVLQRRDAESRSRVSTDLYELLVEHAAGYGARSTDATGPVAYADQTVAR